VETANLNRTLLSQLTSTLRLGKGAPQVPAWSEKTMPRAWLMIIGVLAMALAAPANEDARRAQVAAAAADASRRLEADVLAAPVSGNLTVADLADQTGSRAALAEVLRSAEQVGGTRWIDDQTTQVRLEVTGDAVAHTLLVAAAAHPQSLPISEKTLQAKLKDWKGRTFAATGSSTSAPAADHLRPDPSQVAWQNVSDADCRQAIVSARRNAASRVLDSIGPIPMGGKVLGDALAVPAVQQALYDWLLTRPVTSMEFRDDLEVRLMLAAPPDDFFQVLRTVLLQQHAVPIPADDAEWKHFREQVESRMALPLGRSPANVPGTAPAREAAVIPFEPPKWVRDSISTEAVARSRGPLLRTARVAEGAALGQLRTRVEGLPLFAGQTIGQAAHRDAHIAAALDRAMRRAHTYKVDYNDPDPGSVRVKIQIELEDVWREISLP
jgi:hypothetical protein